MASSTALWFHIEIAFADVNDLCVRARAAELVRRRQGDDARVVKSFGRGRGSIAPVEPGAAPEGTRAVRASELATDLAFREQNPDGADFVELRALLRKRFTWLKARLAEALSDHDVYYALFPIVVYADELVMGVTRGEASRWEPLQSELYDVGNGGELFFSILDERLREDETHPLILEVFYFCLSDGFVGMYQGDTKKIEDYQARIADRIRLAPTGEAEPNEPGWVQLVKFPWQYYALAVAAVIVVYVLFSWAGAPSSS